MPNPIAAIVLAAGDGSRFRGAGATGSKLDRRLLGRSLVARVVAAAAEARLEPIVVVVPPDRPALEPDLAAVARAVVNPTPEDGLASSIRVGLEAVVAGPPVDGLVVLPADQPTVVPATIRALVQRAAAEGEGSGRPFVAARHRADGAPNPVLVRAAGFRWLAAVDGDRGLGPLLAAQPELVTWVEVAGANPDVDTPEDLARLVEAAWAGQVRENRDQVDRVREVPDGTDFYAPVTSLFRAHLEDHPDAVRDALLELARPDETWLDVGAGGGRYALPLAAAVREVVAVDPSPGMLATLGAGIDENGVGNVRPIEGRWPPEPGGELWRALGGLPCADVALIAHVSYDIEAIGSFLDALEAAARRLVVAVLMDRQPASLAEAFWPPVHGLERVRLPGLPEFLELLEARGRVAVVRQVPRDSRHFADRDQLLGFLRRQLWTRPGSDKDAVLAAELDRRIERYDDGTVGLPDERGQIGVATWASPA